MYQILKLYDLLQWRQSSLEFNCWRPFFVWPIRVIYIADVFFIQVIATRMTCLLCHCHIKPEATKRETIVKRKFYPPPERKRRKNFPWKLEGMKSPWIKNCFLFGGGTHSFIIFRVMWVMLIWYFHVFWSPLIPGQKIFGCPVGSPRKSVKGWDQWVK